MDPLLKEKWITALRSGQYQQGRGRLCSESSYRSYCCLGVLADVIDPDGWDEKPSNTLGRVNWKGDGYSFEVNSVDGLDQDTLNELAAMNDLKHMSFLDIAAYIEENL